PRRTAGTVTRERGEAHPWVGAERRLPTGRVRAVTATPTGPAPDDRLVWLDLEMTGLDVTRHTIVEIAVLVTDAELRPLDDGIDLVVHQDESALAGMDDYVRAMHTRSELLPAIRASTLSLADAGAQALEYVRTHV